MGCIIINKLMKWMHVENSQYFFFLNPFNVSIHLILNPIPFRCSDSAIHSLFFIDIFNLNLFIEFYCLIYAVKRLMWFRVPSIFNPFQRFSMIRFDFFLLLRSNRKRINMCSRIDLELKIHYLKFNFVI